MIIPTKWMAATGLALLLTAPLQAQNPTVEWDSHSLIIGGKRVMPVMGEVHYSRIPADEWRDEVRKMKEGGVTIVATYVQIHRGAGRRVRLERTAQSAPFP